MFQSDKLSTKVILWFMMSHKLLPSKIIGFSDRMSFNQIISVLFKICRNNLFRLKTSNEASFRIVKISLERIKAIFSDLESFVLFTWRNRKQIMSRKHRKIFTPSSLIAVRLGEYRFACNMDFIQEIIENPVLDPGLEGPQCIVGVFNGTRGPIPVIDLLARSPDEYAPNSMTLIVLREGDQIFGLLVDDILEAIEIDMASIMELPDLYDQISREFLSGYIVINGIDYLVLNLSNVVTAVSGSKAKNRTSLARQIK